MQSRIGLGHLKRLLHLGQVPDDRLSVKLDDVLLVGVGETFESYIRLPLAYILKRHTICQSSARVETTYIYPIDNDIRGILTLQPSQALIPQAVLGQHAANSTTEDLTTAPFLKHLVHSHAPQTTGAGVVSVVLLLEALLAGDTEVVASDGDDIVTAVGGGVVDGLVLAHEGEGNGGGKSTQTARVTADIDVVPCSGEGETGL